MCFAMSTRKYFLFCHFYVHLCVCVWCFCVCMHVCVLGRMSLWRPDLCSTLFIDVVFLAKPEFYRQG